MSASYFVFPDIIEVVQGSYAASTILALKETGMEPLNLVTANKAEITIVKPDGTKIADAYVLQMNEPANGTVDYSPTPSHVADAGTFEAEIVVTMSDLSEIYIPSRGKLLFIVHEGVT